MCKAIAFSIVFSVFALSAAAQTGDALFSQPYSPALCDQDLQSLALCDDFIPVQDGNVNFVRIWMVLLGGQPGNLTMVISEDLGSMDPNTATTVYSRVVPASYVNTGDLFEGNDVIEVTLTLPVTLSVETGSRYWLELNMPVLGYWLGQQPVVFGSSMWARSGSTWETSQSKFGFDVDSFFELFLPVSLDRNSWASIKASF